jgi:hypothetical protein
MNVELDEMKSAWLALDRRLERQEALNLHVFREGRLDRLRATLRPLVIGQVVQIIAGALLAFLFAPFWIEHRDTPHLLLTGLSLHAYALMFILFGARDLYMIQRIDYAAPVLEIQRRLAELRAWRVRVAPLFGAVGCLIWVPFLLWLFEVSFGVDVYALHPEVAYVFIACGLGCLGIMLLLIRWMRDPRRPRLAKLLEDSVAGRGIAKAQRFVDEVAAFAREA